MIQHTQIRICAHFLSIRNVKLKYEYPAQNRQLSNSLSHYLGIWNWDITNLFSSFPIRLEQYFRGIRRKMANFKANSHVFRKTLYACVWVCVCAYVCMRLCVIFFPSLVLWEQCFQWKLFKSYYHIKCFNNGLRMDSG